MDNFDLRKYLTEGRLLKEAIDYSSIKGEMKKIYDIDVDLDTIKDFVISYNDSEGMDVFDTTEREDFYLYLKDEDRLLKEELTPLQQYVYNFEKEVSGEDNAKEFLDGIKKLNTPKDVYDYYAFERNWEGDSDLEGDLENIYNQVLDKFKSKKEKIMDNFDLKKYLAEGKLYENEEQGYTLFTTNVEYDNGKTGYMYQLVNSEDREENEIGFDQLFFDDEDNRLEMGVDFNSFDQGSYQEGEYTADEAMELYRKISEGVIK